LSMGGSGVWSCLFHSPEKFAACAVICGAHPDHCKKVLEVRADYTNAPEVIGKLVELNGEDIEESLRKILRVPVWVFQGAMDPICPAQLSQVVVSTLKRLGADVAYTEYPDARHDAWTETYTNPELYKWFLSHARA